MPAPVTVWTAGGPDRRAGLTMSSVLIAEGEPSLIVGLMNDTTDLWEAIHETGRWVVHLLSGEDSTVADVFAGVRPSPGGPFVGREVVDTDFGPALGTYLNRAYCRLVDDSASGFQRLLRGAIERVEVDDMEDPLVYFRGHYRRLQ